MISAYEGVIRDERLQSANFLKIAISQSATPGIIVEIVSLVGRKEKSRRSRVPFEKDIGEPVISMNGGITFKLGIV